MINAQQPQPSAPVPNAQLPYDNKTKATIGIGIAVLLVIGLIVPLIFVFYPEFERDQVIKNGTQAPGVITNIEPTGNIVNNQPQVHVTVRVTMENGETFESVATMIINPVYIPQFQPGKKVIVRFDPADHSKIAIEETESGQR